MGWGGGRDVIISLSFQPSVGLGRVCMQLKSSALPHPLLPLLFPGPLFGMFFEFSLALGLPSSAFELALPG